MSGCAEGRFVLVEDVLPEWRAELEFVDVPKRSLPKIRQGQSELGDTVLICDSLGSACWCGGTQEVLENFSNLNILQHPLPLPSLLSYSQKYCIIR